MCSFLLEGLCNSPSWLVGPVQYSLHQIIKKKKKVPQCGEVLASYITIIAMQVCMLSHALSFTSMLTRKRYISSKSMLAFSTQTSGQLQLYTIPSEF